ncbi:MAG TPA: hypothetical protein P5572_20910, partial [Phycisphaerae bacterium]|nr:hypothetical protein [Phycisphaerae bacterium]
MKKRIKRLIAAIVLIPVVLVIVLFVYIDAIAKAGVERGATYALGVNTTLDSMSVGVLRGRVAMEGLDVANPPGFNSDRFLRLGEGRVAVTLGSLMENTVVLPELRLTGINVNLEKKGKSANYQVILDGLKKFESEGEPAAPAKEDAKKFIVKLVTVEDVNVQVDLLGIGGGLTQLPIHLDKIELRDVGSESDGGVVLSQLSGMLIKALLEAIVQKGGAVLPAEITAELNRGLAMLGGLGDASIQVVGDPTLPETYVGAVINDRRNSAEKAQGARRGMLDDKIAAARQAVDAAEARVRDDDRIRIQLPDPHVPTGRRIARLIGGTSGFGAQLDS